MPPEYNESSPILFSYIVDSVIRYVIDTGRTPYITCNLSHLPDWVSEFGADGFINLNLSPRATEGSYTLTSDNYLYFRCRFHGAPRELWVPIEAVVMAFCREDPSIGYQNNGTILVNRNKGTLEKPKVTVEKNPDLLGNPGSSTASAEQGTPSIEKKKDGNVTHVQFGRKKE